MSKKTFKKAFYTQLKKDGIDKNTGNNILNEIRTFCKESSYSEYIEKVGFWEGLTAIPKMIGQLGWKGMVGAAGLGLSVGLAKVLASQALTRKKYMRESLVDDPIDDLLIKIKKMEKLKEK